MNQLKEIRKELKYGDISIIAEQTDQSMQYVSAVLRGRFQNDEVVKAAIEIADQNKKSKKAIEKRIKQVLSK